MFGQFGRGLYEELLCESIFNLAQQFRMSFKDFSILIFGCHFVLLF